MTAERHALFWLSQKDFAEGDFVVERKIGGKTESSKVR
jgi:hypothetical protein